MELPICLHRLMRVTLGEVSRTGRVGGAWPGPVFAELDRAYKPDPSRSPLAHPRILSRK